MNLSKNSIGWYYDFKLLIIVLNLEWERWVEVARKCFSWENMFPMADLDADEREIKSTGNRNEAKRYTCADNKDAGRDSFPPFMR